MISGKINLAALQHAIMQIPTKNGTKVECLVIPIAANELFKSDKGNVYLDFAAFEIAADKRKGDDTHIISQSFKKEKRDAMKAAKQYPPTLGNLRADGAGGGEKPAEQISDFTLPENGSGLPF